MAGEVQRRCRQQVGGSLAAHSARFPPPCPSVCGGRAGSVGRALDVIVVAALRGVGVPRVSPRGAGRVSPRGAGRSRPACKGETPSGRERDEAAAGAEEPCSPPTPPHSCSASVGSSPGCGDGSTGGSVPCTFSYHSPEEVLELSAGSGSAGHTGTRGWEITGVGTRGIAGGARGKSMSYWHLPSLLPPPEVPQSHCIPGVFPIPASIPRVAPPSFPSPELFPSLLPSLESLHPCSCPQGCPHSCSCLWHLSIPAPISILAPIPIPAPILRVSPSLAPILGISPSLLPSPGLSPSLLQPLGPHSLLAVPTCAGVAGVAMGGGCCVLVGAIGGGRRADPGV